MKKLLLFLAILLISGTSYAAQSPGIGAITGTFETIAGGASKYVPYTGATSSATLGAYNLTAKNVIATGGASFDTLSVISNPGFSAYQTNPTSLTDGANTLVVHDTKLFDNIGGHSITTGVYICSSEGTYLASFATAAQYSTGFVAGEVSYSILSKNGSTAAGLSWKGNVVYGTGAAADTLSQGTAIMKLVSGDTLRIYHFQDSGGAVNTSVGNQTWFCVQKLF